MPKRKNGEDLLPREKIFVTNYVKNWNIAKSARIAGYERPSQAGARLMKRKCVLEAIKLAEKDIEILFVRERKTALDALVSVCQQTDDQKAKVMAAKEILAQSGMNPAMKLKLEDDRQMDRDSMIELLVGVFATALGKDKAEALVNGALAGSMIVDVEPEEVQSLPVPGKP